MAWRRETRGERWGGQERGGFTTPVRKLHSIHGSIGSHNVGNMRDRGTRGCAQVQDLAAGPDVYVIYPCQDSSCQLAAERVPHAVLNLVGILSLTDFSADPLLAVNAFAYTAKPPPVSILEAGVVLPQAYAGHRILRCSKHFAALLSFHKLSMVSPSPCPAFNPAPSLS